MFSVSHRNMYKKSKSAVQCGNFRNFLTISISTLYSDTQFKSLFRPEGSCLRERKKKRKKKKSPFWNTLFPFENKFVFTYNKSIMVKFKHVHITSLCFGNHQERRHKTTHYNYTHTQLFLDISDAE